MSKAPPRAFLHGCTDPLGAPGDTYTMPTVYWSLWRHPIPPNGVLSNWASAVGLSSPLQAFKVSWSAQQFSGPSKAPPSSPSHLPPQQGPHEGLSSPLWYPQSFESTICSLSRSSTQQGPCNRPLIPAAGTQGLLGHP